MRNCLDKSDPHQPVVEKEYSKRVGSPKRSVDYTGKTSVVSLWLPTSSKSLLFSHALIHHFLGKGQISKACTLLPHSSRKVLQTIHTAWLPTNFYYYYYYYYYYYFLLLFLLLLLLLYFLLLLYGCCVCCC